MTLSVVVIVAILILIILGYSFNRQDGRLEQGGLLQFASTPSGATVTLDELTLGSRTPSKASVDAKSHHVRMDLSGYRPWQKSIDVQAGTIRWLSYARLIPTDPKVEQVKSYPVIEGALTSPFRQWVAMQEKLSVPTIILADIRNDEVKYENISLPQDAYTAPAEGATQSFAIDSWAQDERHMLIKHTYNTDQVEWIVVDRTDVTRSVNLTKAFAVAPSKVVFGTNNGRNLYIRTDDIVRKINLDDQTLSRPLVSNIEDFWINGGTTVLYTSKVDPNTNTRHVGYIADDMDEVSIIQSYPAATANLKLAFGEYYGKRYIAISHNQTVDVLKGTLPRGTTKADLEKVTSFDVKDAPLWLTIGRTGRFVAAQTANGYTVYDVELQKTDATTFDRPAVAQREMQWIDDYMIWSDRAGTLRFYEFDGANQQDVMPVAEGYTVTLSNNNKYVYSIAKTSSGYALQRAQLILN